MDCSKVQQELPALIYGELSKEEAQAMAAHLDACETCRQAKQEMEEAIDFLDQCPDDALDATPSTDQVPHSGLPRSMRHAEPTVMHANSPMHTDTAMHVDAAMQAHSGQQFTGPALQQREPSWFLKPLPMAAAACLLAVLCLGLFGLKVEKTTGGFVVTVGRPEISAPYVAPARDPAIREVVQTEMGAGMGELFVAMVKHLENVSRMQQEEQELMARSFRLMHEEETRRTRDMVHRVARETAAQAESTQRLFDELAKTYQGDSAETETKEIY